MAAQVDPRFFNFGNAFLGGQQQAGQEQQRNAMLDLDQRRQGLYEQRFAQEGEQMQAQAQQGQAEVQSRAALLKQILGAYPEMAEQADELAQSPESVDVAMEWVKMQQPKPPGQLYQVAGPGGQPVYAPADQAMGQPAYVKPDAGPQAPVGTWGQPFEGAGPDGKPGMFQSHSVTGEVRPASVGGTPLGPKPAKRVQHFRPADYATARQKMTMIRVAKNQLAAIEKSYAGIKNSASSGPGASYYTYTPQGKSFDAAVDQFRGTISGLTRVPGVGSMSDWEGKLDQAKLPGRSDFESVNEQKIQGMKDLIKELELGYSDILSEVEESSGVSEGVKGGWKMERVK